MKKDKVRTRRQQVVGCVAEREKGVEAKQFGETSVSDGPFLSPSLPWFCAEGGEIRFAVTL